MVIVEAMRRCATTCKWGKNRTPNAKVGSWTLPRATIYLRTSLHGAASHIVSGKSHEDTT